MKWNEVKTHKVEFEKVEWKEATLGMRYKKIEKEGRVLRLIELTSEYEEKEWCLHEHKASVVNQEKIQMISFEI